jgi:hypothetical protein
MPIGLTDFQLSVIMTAAGPLPPDKRVVFLERAVAELQRFGRP